MAKEIRSAALRYGSALLSFALVLLISFALPRFFSIRLDLTLLFIGALIASAWYGGRGPGLVVAVAFELALDYFSGVPPYSMKFAVVFFNRMALFVSIVLFASSRRNAENRLRQQGELLSVTLSSIGDAVIATDIKGSINFINPTAEALTGWSMADAAGKPLADVFKIINETTREPVENPVTKVLREGNVVGLANHTVLVARGGNEIPIDDSGAPIRARGGRIIGVILVFRDITERKRAEEERTRVERDYVDFVENAALGLHWVGEGGKILWANQAELDLLGYTHDEYIGRHISDFHADEDAITDILCKLSNNETLRDYEARLRHKDGSIIHVLITSNVRWDKGRFVHTRCFTRDITANKRGEEIRSLLASIVESSDDAIISKTMDGTIISWNKGAERLYGHLAEEVMGRSVTLLMPPDRADDFTKIMETLKRGESVEHYETGRVRKDGQIIQVSLTVSPIKNSAGKVVGASAIARDITERKRAEEEREELLAREQAARREAEQAHNLSAELLLREQAARGQAEEASRMKDEFLATVSHELRTPLNAIVGWAAILRRRAVDADTAARAVETIERNALAQTQLIEDLLDISRIITGRMRLDVQPVEVPLVIQAAVEAIRPAADAKGIRLQVVLDPKAGLVSGDPNRLQQVVWNLLSNAVKFTPKGGRVQVRLERINSYTEITVSDTGKGISSEFLPYVFDRFRQADSSYTRVHGGLGLGLAIVRQLVELHGGSVEAQSSGEGYGATFTVKLPITISKDLARYRAGALQPEASAAMPVTPERHMGLDGLRILIVDDEADASELLKIILGDWGAEVQSAGSAAEGLEALKRWSPDVLISDIEMPNEDGYSLIGKVRALPIKEGGQTPAIALTAHVRAEDRLRALSSGFDAHVSKPMEMVELITVISSLARRTGKGRG
jgi:PAS domain S-box-containing protein